MTNTLWGILLLFAALLGSFAFVKTWQRKSESDSATWLLMLCASNICWAICHALFYLLPAFEAATFFSELRYFFIMASGWLMYLFIFRTLKHDMFSWKVLVCIAALPAANLLMLLINPGNVFFSHAEGFAITNGMRMLVSERGPWYWVHCILSYAPLMAASYIIVRQIIRLPFKYKLLVGAMQMGIILVIVMTLLHIFRRLPYPIDPSPVFILATQVLFYYTLFNSRSLDILFISRDMIFENSQSVLLVLGNDGMIVDFNKKAARLAKTLSIKSLFGIDAKRFLNEWKAKASGIDFEDDESIFTVLEDGIDAHYQIQITTMQQKNGRICGSYMEIKNITPMMTLVHMLQDSAYFDHLTRLPNRNYFSKSIAAMDNEQSLPLCVVVGDVNNLKKLNDTYGHVKGDELLKQIADILTKHAPEGATFSRTGGDEFVGLVPHATEEMMNAFVAAVEEDCSNIENVEMRPASIALGYKIKTSMDQDIMELMHEADLEMYTKKRDRRKHLE